MTTKMSEQPHWPNPWQEAIPVPLEALADALASTETIRLLDGSVVPYSAAIHLEHWRQCGRTKLDAYVLIGGAGDVHAGVRYGASGEQYYSPYVAPENVEKVRALAAKFTP